MRCLFAPITLLCVWLCAGAASAQTLVIGMGGDSNTYPFASTYTGEYQQVYAASAFSSAFSGPITITQIAFASTSTGATGAYTFNGTIGLGTTAATPSSPGSSFAGNKRADFRTVFSGTQTATLLGTRTFDLVFNVTPFTYNPSSGNLLVDIVNTSSSGLATFDVTNTSDALLGRVYNNNGTAAPNANYGLRTQFTVSPAAAPEPGSLALLGTGLAGGVGLVRRRTRFASSKI